MRKLSILTSIIALAAPAAAEARPPDYFRALSPGQRAPMLTGCPANVVVQDWQGRYLRAEGRPSGRDGFVWKAAGGYLVLRADKGYYLNDSRRSVIVQTWCNDR